MFNSIQRLRHIGFLPDTIIDIGAHHGKWTLNCRQIYPDSKYYLFEPIMYDELNKFRNNNQFTVRNVILNETETEVDWFEMRNTGDSIFREKTKHFTNCVPMKRKCFTLDSQIESEINKMTTVFLKIDSQGAEIPILKGSTNILKKADFILLEIPLFGQYNENVPTFLEHIQYMDSIGYVLYEIVEPHYVNIFMIQIDALFVKKTHNINKLVQEILSS